MANNVRTHPAATCDICYQHYLEYHWQLRAACASVGIEHNMSTAQALRTYFVTYHEEGHRL